MFKTRTLPVEDPPAIAALHAAMIQASEQSWEWNGVSLEERDRLRPGVATLAKAVADQLRVEHAARTTR